MRVLLGLLVASPLLLLATVSSADGLPADRQALLFLKSLSFNRSLTRTADGKVKVAILFTGEKPQEDCLSFSKALEESAKKITVGGAPVEQTQISAADLPAAETKLKESFAAAYVCGELAAQTADIIAITRRVGILTFAPTEAQAKGGISIGLILRGSKAVILINITGVKREGADLDPQLLRLAEVIR